MKNIGQFCVSVEQKEQIVFDISRNKKYSLAFALVIPSTVTVCYNCNTKDNDVEICNSAFGAVHAES